MLFRTPNKCILFHFSYHFISKTLTIQYCIWRINKEKYALLKYYNIIISKIKSNAWHFRFKEQWPNEMVTSSRMVDENTGSQLVRKTQYRNITFIYLDRISILFIWSRFPILSSQVWLNLFQILWSKKKF